MKGKTMVIGIVVFVLLVVGAIYFAMMSTINKIKEENEQEEKIEVSMEQEDYPLILIV